jgi:tetratricopeptide (TPR) repeat protein
VGIDVTGLKARDAPALFWRGYSLFWQRDYEAALGYLEAATKLADGDARYWYYRALAERQMGKSEEAARSLQRGVKVHRENRRNDAAIGLALERVQGPSRAWIRYARDRAGTPAEPALARK